MEFMKNLQVNIRDRVNAVSLITEGAIKDVSVFVEHLRKLEPLQGVVNLGKAKGEGILNFVERQAEISRRWLAKR